MIQMKAYQLKVNVKDSKPPVWWRILVPAGISFSAFSLILNELIGLPDEAFSFVFHNRVRLLEPDEEHPLDTNSQWAAADASGCQLNGLLEEGTTFSYISGLSAFRITVEGLDNRLEISHPYLLKYRGNAGLDAIDRFNRMGTCFEIIPGEPDYRTRSGIRADAGSGMMKISCTEKAKFAENAYHQSAREMFQDLAARLNSGLRSENDLSKVISDDKKNTNEDVLADEHRSSLRRCLDWYGKKDIQQIAKRIGVDRWRSKTLDDLREELAVCLLSPVVMRKDFVMLRDDEIDALEDAMAAEGQYRIPRYQKGCFDRLCYMGYVFYEKEKKSVDIPEDLPQAYAKINTPELHTLRHQVEWVRKCLNEIIPPYYAIIPLKRFCRLCRRTENPAIASEDVPRLLELIPSEDRQCSLRNDRIIDNALLKDREIFEYVERVQGDKPYYIMRQNEIEELLENGYPVSAGAYRRFRKHLIENAGKTESEAARILRRLHMKSAYSHPLQDIMDYLQEEGLISGEKSLKEMTNYYQTLVKCTPTFYNRGFTPEAISRATGDDGLHNIAFTSAHIDL